MDTPDCTADVPRVHSAITGPFDWGPPPPGAGFGISSRNETNERRMGARAYRRRRIIPWSANVVLLPRWTWIRWGNALPTARSWEAPGSLVAMRMETDGRRPVAIPSAQSTIPYNTNADEPAISYDKMYAKLKFCRAPFFPLPPSPESQSQPPWLVLILGLDQNVLIEPRSVLPAQILPLRCGNRRTGK